MKYVKYILIGVFICSGIYVFSQNNCDWSTLDDADQTYQTGNFDETIKIINECLNSGFNEQQKIQSYRLLAKTYIALDNDTSTNKAVNELLMLNPKFQPDYLSDPPKFIKIIEAVKKLKSSLIVTSVSKKEENIYETPATALLITEKQLKNRGYLDLEAVIHDLPGFDLSRSNGNLYTHAYQRGYRSINTNRTLFLIDGVEENDLWSSNVYLSRQYALSNIKNIEIIYGPASTMYGSNAFLGVINVITKEPSDFIQPGKSIGFDIRAGYGSYNTKFVDGTFALRSKNNNIAFSITGRMFLSDEQDLSEYSEHDFSAPYSFENNSDTYRNLLRIDNTMTDEYGVSLLDSFFRTYPVAGNLYAVNADSTEVFATDEGIQYAIDSDNAVFENTIYKDLTEAYSIDAKLKIYDFLIGWSGWNKAEGTGGQYTDLIYLTANEGGTWRPSHNYFYTKFDKDINSKLNISNFVRFKTHDFTQSNGVVVYVNRYAMGSRNMFDMVNERSSGYVNIYLFQKSNQLRQEFKTLYQPANWIDIVAGFEARFSSIQGDYNKTAMVDSSEEQGTNDTDIPGGNQFFSRDLGVYAQSTLSIIPNLKITLGLRYDNNLVRQTEGYGNALNPRIALVYTPKTFIIKGIYATAFKDATNREKYSTTSPKREFSNPFLEPEEVKNYEFVLGKSFFNRKLMISATGYFSQYSNIIQEVPVLKEDGTFTNQNQAVGKAEIYGINAFADFTWDKLTAYINYTFTEPNAIDPVDSDGNPQTDSLGNVYNRLRISDISNHQINAGVNYLFLDVLNANFRANFVGKRPTGYNTTVPSNPETFDSYVILNGAISYSPKNLGLTVQFTAFNILNKEYFSPGLDYATGDLASRLIQNRRNMYLSLIYEF